MLGIMVVGGALRDMTDRLGEIVDGRILIQNQKEEREVADNQVIPAGYADQIKKLSQVKGYEEICRAGVQSLDFMDYMKVSETVLKEYHDKSGNITLIYQTDMLENRLLRDEKNQIIAGRSLEPDETGYKAVIGRAIAEQENLKVGDRIHVVSHLGKEMGLEIVGISSSGFNRELFVPNRKASCNHILTTKEAVCQANGTDRLNSIEISLKDCGEAAGFMEEARRLNDTGAPLVILPMLDQYHSYTLLDRYREIGILLSMGMGRGRILLQYGAEILYALILSDVFSSAAVTAAGGILSGWLSGRAGMAGTARISVDPEDMALLIMSSVLTAAGISVLLLLKMTFYGPKELMATEG